MGPRVDVDDVNGLTHCDADAPTLSHGEIDDALVASDDLARGVHDVAGMDVGALAPADESRVFPFGHEADVLALLGLGGGKSDLAGKGADVFLGAIPQREDGTRHLLLGETEEIIRLVLGRVAPPPETPPGVREVRADVMPGGERVETLLVAQVEKPAELDLAVAEGARVGGAAAEILRAEEIHQQLERVGEVHDFERHFEELRDPADPRRLGSLGVLTVHREARHEPPRHVESLFLEEPRRGGTVHAPAHRHENPLFAGHRPILLRTIVCRRRGDASEKPVVL